MKNRSKMILGLASMLGISAGAAAVSGFAWFTTQRTATVGASNFKVGASEGAIVLSAGAGTEINCTTVIGTNGDSFGVTPTAGKQLADVSSKDGLSFYKVALTGAQTPTIDSIVAEDNATGMSKVNTTQMVKVEWDIKVTNSAEGTKVNVFLSNDGAIFKKNSGLTNDDPDYSAYYRLAIYNGANCVFLYTAPGETGYFDSTNVSDYSTVGLRGKTLTAGTYATTATAITNTASAGSTSSVTQANQLLIKDLLGGSDNAVTLKFVVWCEGTATPESAVVASNAVDMAFTLVGLTA